MPSTPTSSQGTQTVRPNFARRLSNIYTESSVSRAVNDSSKRWAAQYKRRLSYVDANSVLGSI